MPDIVDLTGEAAVRKNCDYNYVELELDMDLNGFVGRAMFKASYSTSDSEGIEFDLEFVRRDRPALVKPKLPQSRIAAIVSGKYVWDFWVRPESGGENFLICYGELIVSEGVTPYGG